MNVSPRVLKEAKAQATLVANRINNDYAKTRIKSWADIEAQHHITVPPDYKSRPWTYANVSAFLFYWRNSFEQRLKVATEIKDSPGRMIRVDKNVDTFGEVTLFPEQQGCYRAIYDSFFNKGVQAAYQDGHTGSGKSIIGAAQIKHAIDQGVLDWPEVKWRLHPFMIFTPKGVMEHWKRELERMGLGEYVKRRKIYVISESELATEFGEMFASEQEDMNTGAVTMVWNPVLTPILAIVDEAHHYINPESIRTKKILALIKSPFRKHLLFMSATPMEKVNDAYTFVLACNTVFMDQRVNEDTFKQFAGLLDTTPDRPNREAVKRLRSVLSPYIFSLPYVKPKHKAINVVQLVDFYNDNHRKIYDSAHQRYIEACRKSGKNTMWGRFEAFIALNNYRKTVEPLRAWYLAERAAENYSSGNFATAVGCAFKETITETAFQLIDKYKIPRDKIAIVWGGKREYKTEELLGRDQLDSIIKRMSSGDLQELLKDKALLKRVRITLRYLQDQHEHDESPEQQAYRHARLAELKLLGKQTDNARQVEIDRFQDGTAQICLFTIASGGVGLSFDRNKETLLPREGLFTPVYSGKEFQQVLGRLVRRVSLSDAVQRICMMKGTVEEFHVAPILDEKLKCIAEITNRNFDVIDLLARELPIAKPPIQVRDIVAAAKDAANDNTVVSDFASDTDEDEDDDNGLPI